MIGYPKMSNTEIQKYNYRKKNLQKIKNNNKISKKNQLNDFEKLYALSERLPNFIGINIDCEL